MNLEIFSVDMGGTKRGGDEGGKGEGERTDSFISGVSPGLMFVCPAPSWWGLAK